MKRPAFAADDSPPTIVQGSRSSPEELIKGQVIDALSNDSRLSGRVGVETDRDAVTLTGRLDNPMQIEWAEEDALSVAHVSNVNNEISPSVGGY
jgi:osmotically-inducible protein OsmY